MFKCVTETLCNLGLTVLRGLFSVPRTLLIVRKIICNTTVLSLVHAASFLSLPQNRVQSFVTSTLCDVWHFLQRGAKGNPRTLASPPALSHSCSLPLQLKTPTSQACCASSVDAYAIHGDNQIQKLVLSYILRKHKMVKPFGGELIIYYIF